MAVRYEPIGHVDAMMKDDDARGESISPSPSPFHADSASPLSNTTSATMASPSSSAYLTLADQTFTPLSMDASDYYCSDQDDGRNNFGSLGSAAIARGDSASEVDRNKKVLRPTRSTKELRMRFEASPVEGVPGAVGAANGVSGASVGSTLPLTGTATSSEGQTPKQQAQALVTAPSRNGVPIVSAMIQSFEALQPAITGPIGYDIISTINKNKNLGLVSPPSTLSRTPSPSLSSPSSVAHEAPQSFSRVLNTTSPSRDIVVTAKYPIHTDNTAPQRLSVLDPPEANPCAGQDDSKQEKSALQPVSRDQSRPQNTTQDSHSLSHRDTLSAAAADAKTHSLDTLPALSIPGPPPTSAVADFAVSSVSADTTIVRPTAERPPTAPSHPASSEPASPTNPLFRSPSTASLAISHPTPDSAKRSRSGAFLGNIAALEATAERLSTASSIDLAIREEFDGLKRSDSRRSSILQANRARSVSGSDSASVLGQPQSSVVSRQNSILGTNNVARLGGYSPGGFIMSPHSSIVGAPLQRLRSNSKASSFNVPSPIAGHVNIDNGGGEENLFMARHGPGKSSVRSVASRVSLGLIAELDQPSGLTKEAFDEADRAAAIGEEPEDDDTIRASAHQDIEPEFADVLGDASSPQTEIMVPALDNSLMDLPSPRLQIHQPNDYPQYGENLSVNDYDRPTTSGSNMTYEAQRAFGDFDGVHCDPELSEFPPPQAPQFQEPALPSPRRLEQPPPRPKSYFDPSTGQQMLYYPAPVPAMLNLPPKLSKKPKGATAARNIRRSQIVSAMPQAMPQQPVRESRVWLPDPMEGLHDGRENDPFMAGLLGDSLGAAPLGADPAPQLPDADVAGHHPGEPSHARQASETSTIHAPLPSPHHQQAPPELQPPPLQQNREIRRPQKLTDANRRNTRATMLDDLPPQLRASAFFDLPPVLPKVEVKGGSAMDTLDSILDASAHAPVSAFTDHAFAGKLGAEVYGPEKKKKKKKAKAAASDGQDPAENRKTLIPKTSTGDLVNEPRKPNKLRKRASQLSLLGMQTDQDDDVDGRTTVGLVSGEEGARRTSTLRGTSPNNNYEEPFSPNQLAPDSEEGTSEEEEMSSENEEEEEEEEAVYQGPPTTLLAELQLRKQQNAMRTKPKFTTNGLHTTLLELDTVAEVERKARKGKRINLAWENPTANPDHLEDLDDDEVPLGMLYVAKAAGNTPSTMGISAVMNEVNRPLGLMERRELEDNEPLSQRRDRLQGRDGGLAPMSLAMMQKRMTALTLGTGAPGVSGGLRSMSRLNLGSNLNLPFQGGNSVMGGSRAGSMVGVDLDQDPEDAEFEGETLAQRKARLAAENPLPRARPVSGMFSAELLSQFGGEEENKDEAKDKSKTDHVPEEEETLGQRRKRLQAEREAREREMNAGGGGGGGMLGVAAMNPNRNTMLSVAPSGLEIPNNRLSHRLSMNMSDVLNAHPLETPLGNFDLRTQERLRREAEAERVQRENEAKMAALRAQMPTNLERVSVGARTGGYMGGRFNDGSGGIPGQQRLPSMTMAGAAGYNGYAAPGHQQPGYVRATTMGGNYSGGMVYPAEVNPVYGGGAPYGRAMQLPLQTQTQYPIMGGGIVPGGMQQGQPVDIVERWRQSVMP